MLIMKYHKIFKIFCKYTIISDEITKSKKFKNIF